MAPDEQESRSGAVSDDGTTQAFVDESNEWRLVCVECGEDRRASGVADIARHQSTIEHQINAEQTRFALRGMVIAPPFVVALASRRGLKAERGKAFSGRRGKPTDSTRLYVYLDEIDDAIRFACDAMPADRHERWLKTVESWNAITAGIRSGLYGSWVHGAGVINGSHDRQ